MSKVDNRNELAISIEQIEACIIEVNNKRALIDADVARFYGVETRRINEAVKNNPAKFPDGYILMLDKAGQAEVVENFDHLKQLKYSYAKMTAFTEKGLYMLATILKSEQATRTTLMIIDTFTKLREFGRTIDVALEEQNTKVKTSLIEKSGNLLLDIVEDSLPVTATETTVELTFPIMKLKRVVKRGASHQSSLP